MTPNEMLSMIAQLRRERNEAREERDKLQVMRKEVVAANKGAKINAQVSNSLAGKLNQAERERDEAREAGWKLAMQAVWDRLPMPAYANDPMTPREVAKLIEFVRCQKEETK